MYSVGRVACSGAGCARTGLNGRARRAAVPGVQRRRVRVRGALRAALVELHLVHRPHRALHVLHAHEALVQREVVTHRVLSPTQPLLYLLSTLPPHDALCAPWLTTTAAGPAKVASNLRSLTLLFPSDIFNHLTVRQSRTHIFK